MSPIRTLSHDEEGSNEKENVEEHNGVEMFGMSRNNVTKMCGPNIAGFCPVRNVTFPVRAPTLTRNVKNLLTGKTR